MASEIVDDGQLWQRWRGGEPSAFDQIVRRHTGRLLAVATRLTRDPVEADEVVQDAFIAAFRGAAGFDGRAQVSTWLHRITVNAALARLRGRTRRREVAMEQAFPATGDEPHGDLPDRAAADASARSDVARTVWAAIDALDEEQRTIMVLRDVEELSSKEVAAMLGISDASVRQRLHRARQTVAERLRPELCGGGDITCGGRLDLLLDFLDHALAEEWLEAVPSHVAGCAICTGLADGYRGVLDTVRTTAPWGAEGRSDALVEVVIGALRSRP